MVSSEVQRTLVKSPPELWSELSDPEALGRHLGELGAIRIVRIEPEKAIDWESETASGSVRIEASGWGTRVTLTATTCERPAPDATEDAVDAAPPARADAAGPEPLAPVEPGRDGHAVTPGSCDQAPPDPYALLLATTAAGEPSSAPGAPPEPSPEGGEGDAPAAQPLPDAATALQTQPVRQRVLARLLRWRRRRTGTAPAAASVAAPSEPPQPALQTQEREPSTAVGDADVGSQQQADEAGAEQPTDEAGAEQPASTGVAAPAQAIEPVEREPGSETPPAADPPDARSAAPTLAAELEAAEEVSPEAVRAVLVGVLDRLGSAHHRPFSRA